MFAQIEKNLGDGLIFFLHFLVVASTLFGLPGAHEDSHGLEYFVHSPHMFIQKMVVVNLQEPMIPFVLLKSPMSELLVGIEGFLTFGSSGPGSISW